MSHGGQHQAGIAGSVFLLCSTTLGAGILAMPSVFAEIGVALGAISLTFFGIVTAYSIYLLILAGEASGIKHSYEELMEYAFPKVGRVITSIFIQLGLIGALTAFLVIIGDVLSSTVQLLSHGDTSFYTSRPFMVIIFVICVIFPLSVLRDISLLEYTAFASVFIIFCFVVILTTLGGRAINLDLAHWSHIKQFDLTVNTIFTALPTVSLAYTCQTSVFPIWKELTDPTKKRMNTVQFIGSSVSCVFYVIAGVFGYIYAPENTPGNYLGVLPKSTFYQIFRLFFGLAIVFHFPVVHFAFRNSILSILFPNRDFSWVRHVIVTICIMIVTTAISLVIPDLGKVFELTGALAAYPIDFLLPALAFSKIVLYDGAGSGPKRYGGDAEDNSFHEVLLSRSMEDDGDRGVPASKK